MNLYVDEQGEYWVGNENLGVIFLNWEVMKPGYHYEAEVWSLDEAAEQFKLVLNAVGG